MLAFHPPTLVTDNAHEETHGEWGQTFRVYHIQQKHTAPYSPWQNLAEASARAVKQGIRRATSRKRSPKRLWCYCGQWVAAIRRLTALDLPQLDGQTPESHVLGSTVDISAYAQFDWYEYVWYLEPKASFPNEKKCLGRWLGVAEVSIDVMASYILTDKGTVVVRKSIWGLSKLEVETDEVKETAKELDEQITRKLGNSLPVERDSKDDPADPYRPPPPEDLWDDLDDVEEVVDPFDPESTKPDADESTPEACDECLTAEVLLPSHAVASSSKQPSKAASATLMETLLDLLLDSRQCEVEFPDGSSEAYTANLIAENLLSQVDAEGGSCSILSEIVDHRKNGKALSKDDASKMTKSGRAQLRHTTQGWDLQVVSRSPGSGTG
jgi:hypothetical protein